jgi:hypothetical protein
VTFNIINPNPNPNHGILGIGIISCIRRKQLFCTVSIGGSPLVLCTFY